MILLDEQNASYPEWMNSFKSIMDMMTKTYNSKNETITFTLSREEQDAFIMGINFNRRATLSIYVSNTDEFVRYVKQRYDTDHPKDPVAWMYAMLMNKSNIIYNSDFVNIDLA